jgi:hypothetical protein
MRTADVTTKAGEPSITRAEAVRRVLLETFLRRQLAAGAVSTERVSLIKIQPADDESTRMPVRADRPNDARVSSRAPLPAVSWPLPSIV